MPVPLCAKCTYLVLLFPWLFILLNSYSAHSQAINIPGGKDPRFRLSLNPANNTDIHPDYSYWLHPKYVSRMNPVFNPDINPTLNPSINPFFVAEFNPLYNKELDPRYNPELNPMYSADGVVYNLQAEPAAILKIAWPGKVILQFSLRGDWTGYWVTNGAGGFSFFDTASQFTGNIMWPNGQGGFNVFDEKPDFIAFVW